MNQFAWFDFNLATSIMVEVPTNAMDFMITFKLAVLIEGIA